MKKISTIILCLGLVCSIESFSDDIPSATAADSDPCPTVQECLTASSCLVVIYPTLACPASPHLVKDCISCYNAQPLGY